MRKLSLLIVFFAAVSIQAVTRVSFDELSQQSWVYQGQRIALTTPMIVCNSYKDTVTLAPERLYVPEENAAGLSEGDSTEYFRLKAYNESQRLRLVCKAPYWLNLGATVKNIEATVMGDRILQTGQQPKFKNYKPSPKVPKSAKGDIRVCGANIQNYFVHQGGYASKNITPQQHALQSLKVASALVKIDADLYALCELEKGPSAPAELAAKMSEVSRKNQYNFVRTSETDGDTISVGFIYRTDKIKPVGELRFAYNAPNIYAYRFMLQGFEDIRTGEQFVVSLNHPRSKRGNPQISNERRMDNIRAIFNCIDKAYADGAYTDPDILWLGDYNCYRCEEPIQAIVGANYEDLLTPDPQAYSYSYHGECGCLDRVFASPTMEEQVVAVQHLHWNTDIYYSAGFKSKYNFKDVNSTAPIEKNLTPQAKKNLLYRYSDHDPIIVILRLNKR